MSKAKYHVPQPGEEIEFEDPSGFRYAITVAKWDSKHGIITTDDKRRVYVQNRSSINLVKKAEEFKVGDRVVAIEDSGHGKIKGKRGTIKGFHNNPIYAAVEYDQNIDEGHSCEGLTHKERGWWTALEKLRHLTPEDLAEEAKFAEHPEKEESCAEAGDELRLVDSSADELVAVSTEFTACLPTSFASEVERIKAIADAEAEEKRRKDLFDKRATELDEDLTKILHAQRMLKEEIIADYQDYQNRVDYLRSLRVRGEK